jgi:hypothetical protein
MFPFPLQSGHLFGPATGDLRHHNGAQSLTDTRDLARWQRAYQQRINSTMQVTGRFDGPTQKAAVQVQEWAGLPVTGTIDQATWEAVWTVVRPPREKPPTPPPMEELPSFRTIERKVRVPNKATALYWKRYSRAGVEYGATPDAPYWYPGRPFGANEMGWHIRMCQQLLGLKQTGWFNRQLTVRVRGLQKIHDLPVSGIVDVKTACVIDPPPWPEETA